MEKLVSEDFIAHCNFMFMDILLCGWTWAFLTPEYMVRRWCLTSEPAEINEIDSFHLTPAGCAQGHSYIVLSIVCLTSQLSMPFSAVSFLGNTFKYCIPTCFTFFMKFLQLVPNKIIIIRLKRKMKMMYWLKCEIKCDLQTEIRFSSYISQSV